VKLIASVVTTANEAMSDLLDGRQQPLESRIVAKAGQ
jgi:hypothetical protein